MQRHVIEPGDRVLIVDDWTETGSQAITARRLIEACGGCYVGLSLLVDQLPADLREELAPTASAALAEELRDASRAGGQSALAVSRRWPGRGFDGRSRAAP